MPLSPTMIKKRLEEINVVSLYVLVLTNYREKNLSKFNVRINELPQPFVITSFARKIDQR
jgi:hypothetical protein